MRKATASFLMMAITACTAAALWTWPVERWETVKTTQVTLGSVEKTVSITGTAARKGEYYSAHPSGGVVVQVYVKEGQSVVEGQALYRLDDTRQQAALRQAMQALESARASDEAILTQAAAAFGQTYAAQALPALNSTRAELAAQVETLTAEIESLTQRAYREGEVLKIMAREGELLLPGSPGAVLALREPEVRAEINARDSQLIKEGMRARIIKGGLLLGEAVVEKVGMLTPNGQGIPYAQVVFAPIDGLAAQIGAQVEVDVVISQKTQVPVLPAQAFTDQDKVFEVYGGRAWERSVSIGLWDGAYAAVEGLPVGTEVVLSPDGELRDGVRLKVVKP